MQNRLHLSDCPPDDIDFPYLLAEEVPERILRELREISYEDDPDEWHPDRKLIYQAWTSVELALSPTVDEREADELFSVAQTSLDEVYEYKDTSYERRFEARLLDSFLPAFVARKYNRELNKASHGAITEGILTIFDEIQDTETIPPAREVGYLGRLSILSLGLKINTMNSPIKPEIIYPASWRERRSCGALQPSNHDMYVVSGVDKIAIKSRNWRRKEGREYDEHLVFLEYGKIAKQALRHYGLPISSKDTSDVAVLIEEKLRGNMLSEAEGGVLDFVKSHILTSVIKRHAEDLSAQSS